MTDGINIFKEYIHHNEIWLNDVINNSSPMDAIPAKSNLNILKLIKDGCIYNPQIIMDFINPQNMTLSSKNAYVSKWSQKQLDDSQKSVVLNCLNMNNVVLVQGPPGAGKSTTIAEIVNQLYARDHHVRILLTSQTHVAVDNSIAKIMCDELRNKILRCKIKPNSTTDEIEGVKSSDVFDQIFGEFDNDIDRDLLKKAFRIKKDDKKYYREDELAKTRQIVGVTINSLPSLLKDVSDTFDYVIVDEVGKFNFVELLTAALYAKRLILIGDHKQLPATIVPFKNNATYNEESYEFVCNNSFIEYLFNNANKECVTFLDKQYRMPNSIGAYISQCFYEGKLKNGLNHLVPKCLNYIDYDGSLCPVKTSHKDGSNCPKLENQTEVDIIKYLLDNDLKNVDVDDIAIITPYKAQLDLIRRTLGNRWNQSKVYNHINTVDAFQGKECKYVIFTCTRNFGRPTEFFKYPNRLNVALSRAKEYVYVIGYSKYIRNVSYLKDYMNFVLYEGNKIVDRTNKITYNNKK